jgi:predicted adenylyl cyclase CyaB
VARNVEIKARVASLEAMAAKAATIADQGPFALAQDDTFFRCDTGRLKLRAFSETDGELIFYQRASEAGPKESFYLRTPVAALAALRETLALAYGIAGRVRKRRTLYLAGRTRIHVDDVEGLGAFVELEVVLAQGEHLDSGVAEAENVMARLGIEREQLVEHAYVDLLRAQGVCP